MTTNGAPDPGRAGCGAARPGRDLGRALSVFLCALLVVGLSCADAAAGFYDKAKPGHGARGLEQLELKSVFAGIAKELCTDSCGDCGKAPLSCGGADAARPEEEGARTVLVTDFVDLQSLQPGRYGILMGELMRGSLTTGCCYRIIQAELSRFFKLTESGLVVLTRNASEIQNDRYRQSECVVGTYSLLGSKLLVFVRKINTTTGRITRMAVREIDLDADTPAGYSVR